ncbi:non-classical arabinogalactan protein 31-like [Penaeus japonicus]|uniref:non-classical arabinogalactan protein 31-like n=1 Tax=Penaeus japonicus TaxID=27405 RepID=UPI001C70FE71|nr:non-classical arabinogalactan protein 31-like [Penaeus japonicus]
MENKAMVAAALVLCVVVLQVDANYGKKYPSHGCNTCPTPPNAMLPPPPPPLLPPRLPQLLPPHLPTLLPPHLPTLLPPLLPTLLPPLIPPEQNSMSPKPAVPPFHPHYTRGGGCPDEKCGVEPSHSNMNKIDVSPIISVGMADSEVPRRSEPKGKLTYL